MSHLIIRLILFLIGFSVVTITFWLGGTDFIQRGPTLVFWWLMSMTIGGGLAFLPLESEIVDIINKNT